MSIQHSAFADWLAALEERHLANLTRSEITRALRALSSCYVERRARLARGAALDGAGKRAAFALFYAPLHFLTVDAIVRHLPDATDGVRHITDVGCGTGAAGVAWAAACDAPPALTGVDRNRWAVDEANRTYRYFGLRARARIGDAARVTVHADAGSAVLLAYTVNELPAETRDALLPRIADAADRGTRVLIVEPIARMSKAWWESWRAALDARADEWRLPMSLPPLLRDLAKGAGLHPQALTARSLYVDRGPRSAS